jgi:hypothetical protein
MKPEAPVTSTLWPLNAAGSPLILFNQQPDACSAPARRSALTDELPEHSIGRCPSPPLHVPAPQRPLDHALYVADKSVVKPRVCEKAVIDTSELTPPEARRRSEPGVKQPARGFQPVA